jgi:hypothetical protein
MEMCAKLKRSHNNQLVTVRCGYAAEKSPANIALAAIRNVRKSLIWPIGPKSTPGRVRRLYSVWDASSTVKRTGYGRF